MRHPLLLALTLALCSLACTGEKTTLCASNADCPADATCSLAEGICVRETVLDVTSADTSTPEDTAADTTTTDVATDTPADTTADTTADTADVEELCGDAACGFEETCCDVGGAPTCIDLNRDSAHCGFCSNACAGQRRCVDALCRCPFDLDDCDSNGTCETNILFNDSNCGRCGNACQDGQACSNGLCTCGDTACAPGESCCELDGATYCANLDEDLTNCGTCGTTCAPGEVCNGGSCECDAGLADCDGLPDNGCEQDIGSDIQNCGACNNDCDALNMKEARCCDGACVDIEISLPNCGGCGLQCSTACESRRCGCPKEEDPNNLDFTNLRSDDQNCGTCGTDCKEQPNARNGNCREGVCEFDCRGDYEDCDPDAPGCETNTREDSKNCGGCDIVCPSQPGEFDNGSVCDVGNCRLACFAGLGNCDGDTSNSCETDLTTTDNCGACGRACAAGAECVDGDCTCPGGEVCRKTGSRYTFAGCDGADCILTCNTGYGDCDGSASNGCEANLNLSEAHCGRCGNACAALQTCTSGSCL